jgi:hypothetical protein
MYPNISADNLTEYERIAGPIPRYVLQRSSGRNFETACAKLKGLVLDALDRVCREGINSAVGAADSDDARVSYRILQIEVNSTTFNKVGLRWASPFVEEQFFSRTLGVDLNALWLTYQNTPGSMKGILYETWAHRILAKSGQNPVSMRSLKNGNKTEDLIGKRTLLLQQTYEQMTNMDETTYGVPASRTFPAIDAVCVPYFFQMTIQPSHSITLKPFATFVHDMIRLKKLEKDADIKLVFVVPPAVFDDYRRCVRELTTHWQSPCLVVRCSEQKYILDGNKQYNSTTAKDVLSTKQEKLVTKGKLVETEKTKETKKQDTETAKQDEAERCAIQHALDVLPRIKQYVMLLQP